MNAVEVRTDETRSEHVFADHLVISYALFGAETRYAAYLPAVVRAHAAIFPDWEMRVHIDDHVLREHGEQLMSLQARCSWFRIRHQGTAPLCRAMLWRIAPLYDANVAAVFCRDLDALPMPRDRACMEAFLASPAQVHTILDNPMHDGIMGGLCGFKPSQTVCEALAGIAFARDLDWTKHGADQDVLNRLLLPAARIFVHHMVGRERMAGSGVAESVPERGVAPALGDPALIRIADLLAPYLGSAGFEIKPAVDFYDAHGPRETMDAIRAVFP